MFLIHITNPKSFVFNFWGSLQTGTLFNVLMYECINVLMCSQHVGRIEQFVQLLFAQDTVLQH